MFTKLSTYCLIALFLSGRLEAQLRETVIAKDLINSNIEINQLIRFTLLNDKIITIRYLEKSETYISGFIVLRDMGNLRTTNEKKKIYYSEIGEFELINEPGAKNKILLYFLIATSIGLILLLTSLEGGTIDL